MARTRMIAPGFFTDEDLAAVAPLGRLLYVALWTLADRAGRLEDRPTRIKVMGLPYDVADVDALLAELAAARFIVRYEADGKRLIQIRTFERYQHPHHREPASKLPAPGEARNKPAKTAKPRADTGPAPDEPRTGPEPARRSRNTETVTEYRDGTTSVVPVVPRERLAAMADGVTGATVLPMRRRKR